MARRIALWVGLGIAGCGDGGGSQGESMGPGADSTGPGSAGSSSAGSSSGAADGSTGGTTDGGGTAAQSTGGSSGGSEGASSTIAGGSTSDGGGTTTTDATTSATSGAVGSSGEGGSGGDTGGPLGGCSEACEAGCTSDLLTSLSGMVDVGHDGTTIVGRGASGRAALWRASDRALVYTAADVDRAEIAGGVAVLEIAGVLEIRDGDDGGLIGSAPADELWGLARDGSHLWTAGGAQLSRFELDGSATWTLPGDFSGAEIVALSDELHVFTPASPDVVAHVDALAGTVTEVDLDDTFGGWFADSGRFWTLLGGTFTVHAPDGSELAFAFGNPAYGYGDRMLVWDDFQLVGSVVEVADPDVELAAIIDPLISGPALLGVELGGFGDIVVVRIDDPALVASPVTPACCVDGFGPPSARFAWADDQWVLGGDQGEVFDDDGVALTAGELAHAHGALSGRFGVTTALGHTYMFDLDDACAVAAIADFARTDDPAVLSDDGNVLLTAEKPYDGIMYTGQLRIRFYDATSGALTAEAAPLLSSSQFHGAAMSDDGAVFSAATDASGFFTTFVSTQPGFASWDSGNFAATPGVAPNGLHAVRADGGGGFGATFEDALSYVIDADGPVAVIDGVGWGFVADDRILVGHYVNVDPTCSIAGECDTFVSAEIVDLAGDVVAPAPLPEIRDFERVSDTEIFARDSATIYDVASGATLWTPPPGTITAAPVGSDFVVRTDGSVLTLERWR